MKKPIVTKTSEKLYQRIVDQSEALDLIGKELLWILTETTKLQPKPGTDLGNELVVKFFSLYKDFQKVRSDGERLVEDIVHAKLADPLIANLYETAARLLLRKSGQGIFAQFISVAETGDLPKRS